MNVARKAAEPISGCRTYDDSTKARLWRPKFCRRRKAIAILHCSADEARIFEASCQRFGARGRARFPGGRSYLSAQKAREDQKFPHVCRVGATGSWAGRQETVCGGARGALRQYRPGGSGVVRLCFERCAAAIPQAARVGLPLNGQGGPVGTGDGCHHRWPEGAIAMSGRAGTLVRSRR